MNEPVNNLLHVERETASRAPSVAAIIDYVAEFYGVPRPEMTGYRRLRPIVRPRHIAMWLARNLTPLSLPQIGRAFAGRDHTSVLHGVRSIDRLREQYPALKRATESHLAHFRATEEEE